MEKINFKSIGEKLGKFFSSLGKVAIIVTAMASGYAASEIYHRYQIGIKTHKMQEPKTSNDIKVYMNQNELMLMDIKTGSYQLYDKEVTNLIFNLRANQFYNAQSSK